MATLYRKKPVVVEAMRLEAGNELLGGLTANTVAHALIAGWMFSSDFQDFSVADDGPPHGLDILTLEGRMRANPGDWIIRGVQGEFYPCADPIFRATYEQVADT